MAGSITRTACPTCGMIGYLTITTRFIARPIGEFSLAGAQMKFSGAMKPVLKCSNCTFDLVGDWDGDSHAVFAPPKEASDGQAQPEG